ncbi:MAG: Unknown protein [uncultured Sulfurovum sp.]|uniref:DUF4153 domain-containing protein n=1 Tax=uncultured Sulfurovum sp. TaxID=269237 RepID=A0A6S6STG3_9BACT|nr:MAG: Unknown protein [uncultured Sulfurovum sp.]
MHFFFETIDRWSYKILEVFKRFPLAILSSFMVTIIFMILVEVGEKIDGNFIVLANKLVLVLSLGIFLFPALHLLSKKLWFKIAGILLLLVYYYYLPSNVFNSTTIMHHFLLIFALCFMFLWAPFMDIRISNQNIWEWTQTIVQNLLVSLLLSLVFFIMFYITMYALEVLFSVSLAQRHYLQFALFILGIFTTLSFFSKMPRYIMLVQKNRYADIGLVFTKYILTPSFLIYFLILFAYIIKILISKGYQEINIDLLVLGYTFITIGTYMHWTPLWDDANKKFRALIWGSLFVLSVIVGISIYIRTLETSLDEYYLMSLFTLWLGLISLYFLFIKNASYKWLFFSISLLIVISQSQQLIDISLELYDKALTFI